MKGSHPTPLGLLACCALLGAAAITPAATPDPVKTADETRRSALDALHDGRFDAAEAMVAPLANGDGVRSGDALLYAFVTYWRMLYDPDDRDLQKELEKRLKRTIELASAEMKTDPSGDATLWKGSAHMLRAQLRAAQKKIFGAAFEAKRAKKTLERAVQHGSAPAESDFGLGTYLYYADMLPSVVKGLRALLFLPAGDRDEGLERLQRASRESRYFGLESRIVLANIYADDKERMYAEAETVVADALERYPDAVAVLHGAARLELALYRPAAALQQLERAARKVDAHPDTAASVVLTVRYYAGAAEYLRFRPDRALDWWRPILETPEDSPEPLVRRVQRASPVLLLVPDRAAWTRGVPLDTLQRPTDDPAELGKLRAAGRALERARPALELERFGNVTASSDALDDLAAEQPDDPVLALLAGRARLRAGRGASGLPLLRRAVASERLPATYEGIARLLAGMAADAAGERQTALAWYREAEKQHRYLGVDAARMYQEAPYVDAPPPPSLLETRRAP